MAWQRPLLHRHEGLNANEYFNKTNQLSGDRPNTPALYRYNDIGYQIGGPIKKDKVFVFIAQGLQTPWKAGGRVHAGFARALADVADEIVGAVDQKYRTIYAGHSLGGALATLLASVRRPDHLYTLGSPRVGNAKFAAACRHLNVTRFVNCCDLVTHLFPATRLPCLAYTHVGVPYYIDKDRNVWVNPSESFMRADRYGASAKYILKYGWRKDNVGLRELADHSPINYTDAIKVEASSANSCLYPLT